MKIFEVDTSAVTSAVTKPNSLVGLVDFLSGRATDTNSPKQISQDAFIRLAKSLGVTVSRASLPDLTNQEPLSTVVEPLQPNSEDPLVFKGGEPADVAMPVDKAQDIVAKAAKKAAGRDRGV